MRLYDDDTRKHEDTQEIIIFFYSHLEGITYYFLQDIVSVLENCKCALICFLFLFCFIRIAAG